MCFVCVDGCVCVYECVYDHSVFIVDVRMCVMM